MNKEIGFWCIDEPYATDTGSVMKITKKCVTWDADQGIGVSELQGKFDDATSDQQDFDKNGGSTPSTTSYSLNLWIR